LLRQGREGRVRDEVRFPPVLSGGFGHGWFRLGDGTGRDGKLGRMADSH
jgi:hypothetical protein